MVSSSRLSFLGTIYSTGRSIVLSGPQFVLAGTAHQMLAQMAMSQICPTDAT